MDIETIQEAEVSDLVQWPTAKWWEKQWNPIIGCKPCSPACENCYAAAWAKRFRQSFKPHYTAQKIPWKGVIFCGNMTDLFGEWVPSPKKFIYGALMAQYQTHPMIRDVVYLWLTKRPERLCRETQGFNDFVNPQMLARHFFGFTAENQEWFEKRIEKCIDHSYGINMWLSLEPLLGPIDLYPIIRKGGRWPFKWLVVGCESGPKRRPCKIEWVESIVEQCRAAGVPVFVKQICLPNGKFTNKIEEFPRHLQIRQVPWAKEGENK